LRPPVINHELLDKLDDLSGQYGPDIAELSGWILLTIDLSSGEAANFTWTDNLALAKQLHYHQQPDPHASATVRSIVSRSYYAALSHWRNSLREQPGITLHGNATDHITLRDYLKQNGNAAQALQFDRLRQWREVADYQDRFASTTAVAQFAISMAESVMGLNL
jgi:hypothetical protein